MGGNYHRSKMNFMVEVEEDIEAVVDYLNSLEFSKPPQYGAGGSGILFYVKLIYNSAELIV